MLIQPSHNKSVLSRDALTEQSNAQSSVQSNDKNQQRVSKYLILKIHNNYPGRSTFSLVVNGRKVIACQNPTIHGQTYTLPLQHYTPIISIELYKHTSRYGPIYIDTLEAYNTSLLPKLIFSGHENTTEENTNLFKTDPVRWSELCDEGILVHQGQYIYRQEHIDCPFLKHNQINE